MRVIMLRGLMKSEKPQHHSVTDLEPYYAKNKKKKDLFF